MKSKIFAILVLLLIMKGAALAAGGFPHDVLKKHEFGPSAMSHEIFEYAGYSWGGVYEDPSYYFNIKVVVYRNETLESVKKMYPIDKTRGREQDYRYIKYKKALAYLDANIKENVMQSITETLIKTRLRLIEKLGSAAGLK